MFAAIEKGDIAVQLSFKDATQGRIRIENKTDKPLNVKLPDAFAGVPVLAQAGGGGGGHSSSSSSKKGGNQSMGGGGGMGGGMGMFNVAPEKVGQIDVPPSAWNTASTILGPTSLMRSNPWKASRPRPASANCANRSARDRSTSGPHRPPRGI